jgi:hypothetical protein
LSADGSFKTFRIAQAASGTCDANTAILLRRMFPFTFSLSQQRIRAKI